MGTPRTLTEPVLKDKTKNQINVIYPYRTAYGGWSFDDAEVGLQGEPFVANVPEIIDTLVGDSDTFEAQISKDPIPNYSCRLMAVNDEEHEGDGWYQMEGSEMVGWLCPATLRYFDGYPENIYVKIKTPKNGSKK